MQPLTSKLAAHLGTSHIEILDYLDYEAEQAASVIDRFADDIATLPVAHHYIIQMHVHKLSQNLPNLVGKSVYDALLRCGERSAGSTTAALVKAIPLDYMPVRITTQEAVGGGILKAVIRTVKGAAPVIALTKNAIRDKFYDLLIEPIKRTVLEKIVLGGAAAIQRLMQTVRTTVNPQKLAQIFVDGISSGKDRRQIATDLRNELGVTRAAAKRLTRTEGARVASESNMAAYEELGDMVMGYQIHAVLDERTRPQHRIRNGTIYYKEPVGSQKSVTEMPRPPVEPDGTIAFNCRCFLSPVFRPLDNFDRSLFRNAEKQIIGDLITYDDWFRQATERQKRIAVGSRRYDQVTKKHGENASYFHFVDDNGDLMALDELAKEKPADTNARIMRLRTMMAANRDRRRDVLLFGEE